MRLAAASLLVALAACTSETYDPMERQPKYKPYSKNPFYEDGRAMRLPPEGTVAREQLLGDRALTAGVDASGAPVKTIPLPVTRALLEQGRHSFEVYCAACHGLAGDGDSIVGRNMNLRAPPSLLEESIKAKPIGHHYRAITEGYGLMASYATELDTKERWATIAYLRALQLSQAVPLAQAPADVRAQLEQSKRGGAR